MPRADAYGVASVLDVLTDLYELTGEIRGNEFDMICPNPNHPDSHPSTSVNVNTGYWHCFSCGKGGDIVDLGEMVLRQTRDDIEALLTPSSPEALLTTVKAKIARRRAPAPARARPVALPGPYEDGPLDELEQRGFYTATLLRWGVRYVREQVLQGKKGAFTIRDCFALPISDRNGNLLAWCYRAGKNSPDWQPRYLYTPEVEISELWGGLNHTRSVKSLVVVEGYLDMMWCHQNGFPSRALLGSNMGDKKILQLQDCEEVILLGDLDNAGAKWVTRVGNTLGRRMPVRVAQYHRWMPDQHGKKERATDPQELLPVDLEIVLATAMPYTKWAVRRKQK